MLAVVKKPHTNTPLFEVKGEIPSDVMVYLQREFGARMEIVEDDEKMVNIFHTEWYKEISSATTPGECVKIYRENLGLTQKELGEKLGILTCRSISEIEHNKRQINREIAKGLSQIFHVPAERFLS